MKGRWFVICLASVLFWSAFVDDSKGTMILTVTLEQLSRESELIVTGDVEDVKRYVLDDSDQSYNSVSYVAVIRVNDTIKGKITNERILVESKTAEKKKQFFWSRLFRRQAVPGVDTKALPFKEGEWVVLFLRLGKSNVYDGNSYYIFHHSGKLEINRTTNTVSHRHVSYSTEDGERKRLENIPLEELIEKIKKVE